MKLVLIRHAITAWNLKKRIQGRIDQPLCQQGIDEFKNKTLPPHYKKLTWFCSPLQRARQTADLLALSSISIEPALIEMHWGDWEGEILKPLRKTLGAEMRINEAKGLDFCPPNGESPRQVQQRLMHWLKQLKQLRGNQLRSNNDVGAIVHKGIVRCLYAKAVGWDMCGEIPTQLNWHHAHEFEINPTGEIISYLGSVNLYHCQE